MSELRQLQVFQQGKFCVSDGTSLAPSEIIGTPHVGDWINEANEISASDQNPDCVGGQCPIR